MTNLNELLNQTIEFEAAPQDLCLKCGRCCSTITSVYTRSELLKMANNNEEEAKVFINTFKPYSDVNAAKEADFEHAGQILDKLKSVKKSELTFYYCPYVSEDKLCKIYSQRPECCKRAPNNGWSLFPPGCGYEGWQFEQREKHKKHVRKLKEALYELELLISDDNSAMTEESAKDLKEKIINKIASYQEYGADNW